MKMNYGYTSRPYEAALLAPVTLLWRPATLTDALFCAVRRTPDTWLRRALGLR